MGLMETLRLVKVYLEKNPKGIVIINLDPWGFSYSGGGLSANLVGDYRLVEGSRHVRDALRLEDVHWSDWMPGIRFQGALRNTLASYINARKAVTKKIDAGAELALTSRSEQEWKVINAKLRRFDWNVYDEGMKLLSEVLAAGRNAQLVLVVGPVSPFKRGLYDGRSKLESFLDEQRRHPGILVLNYFDREEFESSDFADPDHLNIYGAEKFSALLRDDLTEAVPSFR